MQDLNIKSGDLVILTDGDIAEAHNVGVFVALIDFNMAHAAQGYEKYCHEQNKISASISAFPDFLVSNGFASHVKHREIHAGFYNWEPEFGVTMNG